MNLRHLELLPLISIFSRRGFIKDVRHGSGYWTRLRLWDSWKKIINWTITYMIFNYKEILSPTKPGGNGESEWKGMAAVEMVLVTFRLDNKIFKDTCTIAMCKC